MAEIRWSIDALRTMAEAEKVGTYWHDRYMEAVRESDGVDDVDSTGEQVLAWIDNHADALPPLADWQREMVKAWFDGGRTVLWPKRSGKATARQLAIRAATELGLIA